MGGLSLAPGQEVLVLPQPDFSLWSLSMSCVHARDPCVCGEPRKGGPMLGSLGEECAVPYTCPGSLLGSFPIFLAILLSGSKTSFFIK